MLILQTYIWSCCSLQRCLMLMLSNAQDLHLVLLFPVAQSNAEDLHLVLLFPVVLSNVV